MRILHLEDDPDFCELVKVLLARDGIASELVVVSDLDELNAALEKTRFDIILADYQLPSCSGMQALEEAARRCPGTPFVVVSGAIGEEAAIEGLKRGATDYVLKQWPERLAPVIRRAIREARERAQFEQAQKELGRREKYLRALTENSLDVLCTVTPGGVVTYTSPSVKHVLGYEPEEFVGQQIFSLVHPDDVAKARKAFEEGLLNAELRVRHELRFRKRDQSWCHLEVVGQSHLDNPEIAGVVLSSRDISQRRQVEATLRLQSAALESAANAIVITDRAGRVIWANAAFSRLTGYSLADVLGQSPRLLKSGKHDQAFYRNLWETVIAGRVWHSEMINRHKDGHLYTEEATITPVRDEHGEITHFIAVKQDISDRKRAELDLQRAHNQLLAFSRQAAIAEFATGILHNVGNVLNSIGVASTCLAQSLRKSNSARLSQVVALLREHETNLGNFFTTDPRGKLVPGYLSQLAEKLASEQASALHEIDQLERNLDHIKAIVTLQQDSAKAATRPEVVKLADLVADALKMNSNALVRGQVQVIKEFAEIPATMLWKHGVLQILVNLIRNAIQACEASSAPQRALNIRVNHSNDRFRIAITDNGVGISNENLAQICNLGFTTKKDGHGFGLHSALAAAKEMGGSLTVQSDGPGRGATFTLELPANPASGPAAAAKSSDRP